MICPHGFRGQYCARCGGNTTRGGMVVHWNPGHESCPHLVRDGWCDHCKADINPRGVVIPAYYPSEKEIKEACAEIQSGWTEVDRMHRLGINPEPLTISEWKLL